jgi:hypothetical protein
VKAEQAKAEGCPPFGEVSPEAERLKAETFFRSRRTNFILDFSI